MRKRTSLALVGLILSLAVAGCAPAGGTTNEVQVRATEFKFEASQTTFELGKTYKFLITNNGTVAHEWMMSPRGRTEQIMIEVTEDELKPGATIWKEFAFKERGEFEFACRVPGHYEAGMVLPITVR